MYSGRIGKYILIGKADTTAQLSQLNSQLFKRGCDFSHPPFFNCQIRLFQPAEAELLRT